MAGPEKKYLAFQVNIQTTLADTGISLVYECFIINFEHCLEPGIYPMCSAWWIDRGVT